MRECQAEGCPHPAPGYNEFCDQHGPPDWRCECGDLNRAHHQILAENERLWEVLEHALEHIGTGHAHIAGELLRDALRGR